MPKMIANMVQWTKDADGIVTLTLDDPDQRANTMNATYRDSMGAAVDRLEADKDSITGRGQSPRPRAPSSPAVTCAS